MADKIVAEYTVKVDKALKDLNKLAARVDKVDKERVKTQEGFKTMSEGMVSNFKKVGAAIGIAFGTQQIISFAKEAVTLAAKAEGIERAFAKLNNPNLLADLRKATRGTVSDLQLMQQAVRAQNFKVPLEQLAGFFKFATNRAIETGESVDYLVNSIIDGIGRKSTLVLDNLGISATELQEEIKKTGDFGEAAGNIIARELAKAGDVADTTSTKIAQLGAAFENLKKETGESFILLLDDISKTLKAIDFDSKKLADEDALASAFRSGSIAAAKTVENIKKAQVSEEQRRRLTEDNLKFYEKAYDSEQEKIAELVSELDSLEGQSSHNARSRRTAILNELQSMDVLSEGYLAHIDVFARYLDMLDIGEGEADTYTNNIVTLNKELSEFKKKLSEAVIGGTEFFDITEKIADKTKELNEAIAQTKLQDAFIIDDDEPFEVLGDGLVEFGDETENATTHADDAWNAHFENLMNGQDEAFENGKKLREKELSDTLTFVAAVQNIAGGLSDLQQALSDQELANLKTQLDQEQITREQYDVKRKELLNKQAEDDKQFAIFDAVISGAVAVVKAFADGGPVLAALVAAGVALQVATIAATPTPQFAEGGWVDSKGLIHGRSHAGGGVKIEAEGNEYITAGKYAKPNAAILEAINTGNWEKYKMENIITPAINQVLDGGFSGMGASYMLNNNFNDRNMLTAFDRNRKSERDSARFIVSELTKSLGGRKRGNYA